MNIANEQSFQQAMHLIRQGRPGEAEGVLERIAQGDSNDWRVSLELGVLKARRQDYGGAVGLLERVIAKVPGNVRAKQVLGSSLIKLRERDRGLRLLADVAHDATAPAVVAFQAGMDLLAERQFDDAAAALRQSQRQEPNRFEATRQLAEALRRGGRIEESLDVLRDAVEKRPGDVEVRAAYAAALERANRMQDADRVLQEGPLGAGHPSILVVRGGLAVRQKRWDEAKSMLEKAMGAGAGLPLYLHPLSKGERITAGQLLAQVCEQRGEFEEAFRWLASTKPMVEDLSEADHDSVRIYDEFLRFQCEFLNATAVKRWEDPPPGEREPPVFMIGFPRSGTTLLEQILAAHPDVVTTDETPALHAVVDQLGRRFGSLLGAVRGIGALAVEEVVELRRTYWDVVDRHCGQDDSGARLIVDKHPMNAPHLFAARRLFPKAKVLLALRDPRDACLSCFANLSTATIAVAKFHSLSATAAYYGQLLDVALHMRTALGLPWLDVRYEDVVADPRSAAEGVLRFLDLPWANEVMDFTEKARQKYISTPSYRAVTESVNTRAVGKWRNYAKHFEQANEILRPYLERFGYDTDSSESTA